MSDILKCARCDVDMVCLQNYELRRVNIDTNSVDSGGVIQLSKLRVVDSLLFSSTQVTCLPLIAYFCPECGSVEFVLDTNKITKI